MAAQAQQLGHDVRVVAATLVRALGVGQRGLKNDQRDARTLSEASCRIVESLEQLGGQVAAVYPEKHIFDIAGFPKINGQEYVDRMVEQGLQYDPDVHLGGPPHFAWPRVPHPAQAGTGGVTQHIRAGRDA